MAGAGEVILAAGAIRSPQILLLSGVGPAAELRDHGIAPIVDSPGIGRGLHDHPLCLPEWRTPATRNLYEEATPENLALRQREQRGPLSSNGAEAGGFLRTREGLPAPDLHTRRAARPLRPTRSSRCRTAAASPRSSWRSARRAADASRCAPRIRPTRP